MLAIIFGAGGQDGYYLKNLLEQQHYKVIAISRREPFLHCDISSLKAVEKLISSEKPEFIFHLAANSTTRHDAMFENIETISIGTLNILEAVKRVSPNTKVFISGSGLQFLNTGNDIKESDPFYPNDAYALSRIHSVYAARYFRSYGLKIYVGYFFNHDSPLRSERHVTKMIIETVKRIAAGSKEKLEIGDLSVIKEWGFAGDIVRAIRIFTEQDAIFEANLSNGEGHSIEEWINVCFKLYNIDPDEHVRVKSQFVSSYKRLVSDNSLIKSLGYKPEVSFTDLAYMMTNS